MKTTTKKLFPCFISPQSLQTATPETTTFNLATFLAFTHFHFCKEFVCTVTFWLINFRLHLLTSSYGRWGFSSQTLLSSLLSLLHTPNITIFVKSKTCIYVICLLIAEHFNLVRLCFLYFLSILKLITAQFCLICFPYFPNSSYNPSVKLSTNSITTEIYQFQVVCNWTAYSLGLYQLPS